MIHHSTALSIIRNITPVFTRNRFLCGLYGSCLLEEQGRDIDILAIPLHRSANNLSVLLGLEERGWRCTANLESGILADSAIMTFKDHPDFILDIRFSRFENKFEDKY